MTSRKTAGASRPPALMTLQAAAAEMGVPYNSIRDMVLEGHLRRVQLGTSRRIWVRRADVEHLVTGPTE